LDFLISIRVDVLENKKADETKLPQEFSCVGLLTNERLGAAQAALYSVFRYCCEPNPKIGQVTLN